MNPDHTQKLGQCDLIYEPKSGLNRHFQANWAWQPTECLFTQHLLSQRVEPASPITPLYATVVSAASQKERTSIPRFDGESHADFSYDPLLTQHKPQYTIQSKMSWVSSQGWICQGGLGGFDPPRTDGRPSYWKSENRLGGL